jgi:hypothetical protein
LTGIAISTFEEAIRSAHGATAQFLSRQIIRKFAEGKVVWESEVLTFQLLDHPTSSRCYAWEKEGEITLVLGESPVNSAIDAVASVIASDVR